MRELLIKMGITAEYDIKRLIEHFSIPDKESGSRKLQKIYDACYNPASTKAAAQKKLTAQKKLLYDCIILDDVAILPLILNSSHFRVDLTKELNTLGYYHKKPFEYSSFYHSLVPLFLAINCGKFNVATALLEFLQKKALLTEAHLSTTNFTLLSLIRDISIPKWYRLIDATKREQLIAFKKKYATALLSLPGESSINVLKKLFEDDYQLFLELLQERTIREKILIQNQREIAVKWSIFYNKPDDLQALLSALADAQVMAPLAKGRNILHYCFELLDSHISLMEQRHTDGSESSEEYSTRVQITKGQFLLSQLRICILLSEHIPESTCYTTPSDEGISVIDAARTSSSLFHFPNTLILMRLCGAGIRLYPLFKFTILSALSPESVPNPLEFFTRLFFQLDLKSYQNETNINLLIQHVVAEMFKFTLLATAPESQRLKETLVKTARALNTTKVREGLTSSSSSSSSSSSASGSSTSTPSSFAYQLASSLKRTGLIGTKNEEKEPLSSNVSYNSFGASSLE